MRATVFHAKGDVRVENVPDPKLRNPTDAVVRITHACVCGSDLWFYRGVRPWEPGWRSASDRSEALRGAGKSFWRTGQTAMILPTEGVTPPAGSIWKNWNNRKPVEKIGRRTNPDKDLRRFRPEWNSMETASVLEESPLDESTFAMAGRWCLASPKRWRGDRG